MGNLRGFYFYCQAPARPANPARSLPGHRFGWCRARCRPAQTRRGRGTRGRLRSQTTARRGPCGCQSGARIRPGGVPRPAHGWGGPTRCAARLLQPAQAWLSAVPWGQQAEASSAAKHDFNGINPRYAMQIAVLSTQVGQVKTYRATGCFCLLS